MPLYYKIHLKINIYKLPYISPTFRDRDIQKIQHIITQNIFQNQNIKTIRVRTTFRGSNFASLQISLPFASLQYIILYYTPFHYTPLHYTTLHNTTTITTLHYTPLHCTTLHYTPLHSTTVH